MLITYGCEEISATLADLTVPKGLGVTQVIPHIQQLNPFLPLLTQASLEALRFNGGCHLCRETDLGHSQLHP